MKLPFPGVPGTSTYDVITKNTDVYTGESATRSSAGEIARRDTAVLIMLQAKIVLDVQEGSPFTKRLRAGRLCSGSEGSDTPTILIRRILSKSVASLCPP